MKFNAVLGLQWGDEGKAKIIDLLSKESDVIVRFAGGANAGHTVNIKGEKFVFHLVPSGMFYEHTTCLLGNGVVIDIETMFDEIEMLENKGLEVVSRLGISNRAHIVFPFHIQLDGLRELARGNKSIGTTKRGIGPCYEDKITRRGLRFGDMKNWDKFLLKLGELHKTHAFSMKKLYDADIIPLDEIFEKLENRKSKLMKMITDVGHYVRTAESAGKRVLVEGAQGSMLDIEHGTYPFVTSSVTTSGNIFSGTGLSPKKINIIGVVKAYCTRVGNGPLPGELFNEQGNHLGTVGKEFGATTERPRRCSWLDLVSVKYSTLLSGVDEIYLTKLDVLSGLKKIKLITGYKGYEIGQYPATIDELEQVEVDTEEFDGWDENISYCKNFSQMPENARKYVMRIQEILGVPVNFISVGAEREQNIPICS
ncbi:MAG: adenylosuccinate synthase [Planctomycetes bacterium]|nr:adenylosuccinate synthase [Planctomycetota bacterium]